MADPATPDLLEELRERLEAFLAEGGPETPERFAVLEELRRWTSMSTPCSTG